MRPPSPGKSSRERSRGPEEGGGTDVGLSIPASEKVRVAAEKEMPEEVGKKEGRGVSGAKGKGKCEGAVAPESLPTIRSPTAPHPTHSSLPLDASVSALL